MFRASRLLTALVALTVTGCVEADVKTADSTFDRPSSSDQMRLFASAYQSHFGEPVEEPKVGSVKVGSFFGPLSNAKDYYFCVSWAAYEIGTVYAANGRVLRNIGDKYREHGMLLAQLWNGEWRPVLFKPFTTTPIGTGLVSDYCPDA